MLQKKKCSVLTAVRTEPWNTILHLKQCLPWFFLQTRAQNVVIYFYSSYKSKVLAQISAS